MASFELSRLRRLFSRIRPRTLISSFFSGEACSPATGSKAGAGAGTAFAAAASVGAEGRNAAAFAGEAIANAVSARVRNALRFLKLGSLAAVTAAVGTAGCVTYAWSLEEVERMRRELQEKAEGEVPKDASYVERFGAAAYQKATKASLAVVGAYSSARGTIEDQIRQFADPCSDKLLPDLLPEEQGIYTLVLDLTNTLVSADWQRERGWRTYKRQGVDAFLAHLAQYYELVLYSDHQMAYVDVIVETLDPTGCIRYRLSRSATKYSNGKHYRDLSKLNRNPTQVLYVSAYALENSLQPENCIQIKPWKLESDDTGLIDLIPFLEYVAITKPADVRTVLASYQGCDIPEEFIRRSKEYQKSMQEKPQGLLRWR